MLCMKKHALACVAGIAIGLFWAQAVLAQQPEPGGPPPNAPDAPPDAQAPPGGPHADQPGPPPGGPGDRRGPPPNGPGKPGGPGGMGMGPGGMMQPGGGMMPGGGMGGPGAPGGMPPGMGPGTDPFQGPPGKGGRMFGPPMMREMDDPEMFKLLKQDMELEQQSRALARDYRNVPEGQREKVKKQIVELINKQFDVRQQRRALELKRLEDQLKQLREMVEKRAKARKDLVEKRITELIGPKESDVEF
jgi:hypothetical protein